MRESVIQFFDLAIGNNLVIQPEYPRSSWGQGGKVTQIRTDGITMECGPAKHVATFTVAQLTGGRILLETPFDATECISYPDGCRGEVEEHFSRSGMTSAMQCAAHWNEHNDRLDQISRDYPDSPMAPSWFDPSYAGETWDNTDY